MRRSVAVVAVAMAVLASACSSDGDDAGTGPAVDEATVVQAAEVLQGAPEAGACDDSDEAACLLPWPNDRFTRADADAATGRRVDLPADGMPANAEGLGIDPAEWNRNDGFSPVSHLITVVEDLDPVASDLPVVTDIGAGGDGLIVVEASEGPDPTVPAWAELDANAPDPSTAPLLIVPAVALAEGRTYVVGLRGLVRTDGSEVEPSAAFQAQMDDPDDRSQAIFDVLAGQGWDPAELDLAWSFTVGSADDLSGRLRHMWAETSAEVGEGAPPFTVDEVTVEGPARIVRGTFEMPRYLTGDGGPGTVLANEGDPDGLPEADGTMDASYLCLLPDGANSRDRSQASDVSTVIYGHGLLGSREEATGLGSLGVTVGLAFCALDFIGMSTADVEAIVDSFSDLTAFRTVPDRLQQGHLGFLLLGRLIASAEGFATDPAFQDPFGAPILAGSIAYLGASQGGILGGAPSSLAEDWDRSILAVGGMGYNLLLRRSIEFDEFLPALEASYPDPVDQAMLPDLLEQLWQRGENAAYAQHL
ncbi:MAG: hypothetical protein KDA98_01155, partial [Acidimicrobiales bacterium]|nr:hypothetical protein [Acidimicrobiales bacterium]